MKKRFRVLGDQRGAFKKMAICTMAALLMGTPATVVASNSIPVTSSEETKTVKITGVVTETNGTPLPGATVQIKGTTIGMATDIDGKFTLLIPENVANKVLVVSFMGMKPKEVAYKGQKELKIALEENVSDLDEVVIVGYQSMHKRNVTGSVSRVKADAIKDIPAASITEMLNGKVTGLQAISSGGAPGSKSSLVIRGNTVLSGNLSEANEFSDPLYVIDGIPTTLQDIAGYDATNTDYLASLNPDDIESIDILKDASAAAIYGSRGANGVIIIKTKGGHIGKTEVSVKASYGITMRPDLKSTPVGMAERRIKMDLINKWWPYATHADGGAGNTIMVLTDSLNPAFNNNIDYQDLFYQTGHVQNYDVALSGGTEEVNYRLSMGYYNEKGIVVANGYDRYTMNLNLSMKPYKSFRNNTVLRFAYGDRKTGQGSGDVHNVFPVKPQDLNSSLFTVTDEQFAMISGKLEDLYNTNRNVDISISNLANLDLWKGLALNSQIGLVYGTNRKNYFQPSSVRDDGNGYAYHYSSQRMSANVETYLTFTEQLGENHNINVLLGNTFDFTQMEYAHADATGGSGDMIHTIQGFAKDDIFAKTDVSMNAMVSFWARLGYRYKDRYLIEGNFRRDASSRFGANSRWGNFPAISGAWIFSDEPFMARFSNWLDYAKVKASWGRNGKQFSEDYLRYNMYQLKAGQLAPGDGAMDPDSYNGVQTVLPDFGKLSDRGLSWEESTQWDIGLEVETFNRRLNVTFDAYNRETESLLFDVAFPAYTGFNQVKANVAGIMNYGVELAIDAYLFDRASSHQIEVQAGVTHNNNKVTKLPNGNRDYYTNDNYGYSVGRPGPIFYGLTYVGPVDNVDNLPVNPYTGKPLDPTMGGIWGSVYPGYPLYDDISGDYVVSDKLDQDQSFVVKNVNPKVMGHLNFVFTYKALKLRVNSQFAFGRDVYDQVSAGMLNRYGRGSDWVNKGMINPDDYNFWTEEGCGAYYPALVPSGVTGVKSAYPFRGGTTMWWENGNYWKINDLTLSYNFNENALKSLGLGRIYVYGTAYNVWQWQKSKTVMDVTTSDAIGRTLGDGYPLPRKFVLGVNVHF